MKVRTRIAPSPTGVPHIGNTRTALYDYLLAKKYGGDFILRIEDTDQKRLVPDSITKIYQIMEFLHLTTDEDPIQGGPFSPYIQTERLDIYQEYARQLINLGIAYESDGAIRIKMPDTGYAVWQDLVQGKISFPFSEVDDKVLLKSDGIPTYHLAVVVDDHLMEISHALRGVEWISSTPVHILLYEKLGWEAPIFAHVPLLLGPDRTKLSKRHGAKSVLEYRDDGYLPEAINNFLFYLGFSYKDNSDLLTLEDMVQIFDEHRIQKQNAIFDLSKLKYLNSQWIKKINNQSLIERLKPFLPSHWQLSSEQLNSFIPLVKDRLVTLADIGPLAEFFVTPPSPAKDLILTHSEQDSSTTCQWFKKASDSINHQEPFDSNILHEQLKIDQQNSGLTPKQAFMSLRIAITGQPVTPPLFDVIIALGKKETIARISHATHLLT